MSKGFTIIEMIIAIAVLAFGVVLVYGSFYAMLTVDFNISSRLTASYLAQEALEIVRNLRDNNATGGGGGTTWVSANPPNGTNQDWKDVDSSSSGQYLIAVGFDGLYISDDYGVDGSWSPPDIPGGNNQEWQSVASSASGQYLIVGAQGGYLYTSDDHGVTWLERQPAGTGPHNWYSTAISANGQHMIAGPYNPGHLYFSDDYGVNWSDARSPQMAWGNWLSVSGNSDLSTIIAADYAGALYVSTNSGNDWSAEHPSGLSDSWQTTAASADGSYLFGAVAINGPLYRYDVANQTWSEINPAEGYEWGNLAWTALDVSSDGSHIIAGALFSDLYTSDNYGSTWSPNAPGDDESQYWQSAASNSDGTSFIAMSGSGSSLYVYSSGGGDPEWAEGLTGEPCDMGCMVDYHAISPNQVLPYVDTSYLNLDGDNFYSYDDIGGTPTMFKRKIVVTPVPNTTDIVNVTVTVMWSYNSQDFTFTTSEYLYNWH